jgi:tetratricopeptide (TPR) repeat protein
LKYDFNILERVARELFEQCRYQDALRIYYFMSDGDPSLDAGYLGKRIAECYAALGELHAAKYWYGRAIEENPAVNVGCADALDRIKTPSIDDLLSPKT